MRKLLIICAVIIVMASCSKEGEIKSQSAGHIKINGKEYKFIKIVPADGESAVWLLVPNDATVEVPRIITTRISCGKNCSRNQSAILIES